MTIKELREVLTFLSSKNVNIKKLTAAEFVVYMHHYRDAKEAGIY